MQKYTFSRTELISKGICHKKILHAVNCWCLMAVLFSSLCSDKGIRKDVTYEVLMRDLPTTLSPPLQTSLMADGLFWLILITKIYVSLVAIQLKNVALYPVTCAYKVLTITNKLTCGAPLWLCK